MASILTYRSQSLGVLEVSEGLWLLLLQQFQFTVKYKPGGSNGNADGLSRRLPPVESNTLSTKADEESATTEGDPEVIALLHDPEPGSLHLLFQVQTNNQVLQEVKITLQQDTTLPQQFQGKRDKLVQKEGSYTTARLIPHLFRQSSFTAYKEPSWSKYMTKGDILVSTTLWQS